MEIMTTMPILMNFTPANRLQAKIKHPGRRNKNSALPRAGEMPNNECRSLPLPVI
jgi:hypothetical protein